MRIIGGRDYYDSVLQFGRDEKVVLIRPKDLRIDNEKVEKRYGLTVDTQSFDPYSLSNGSPIRRMRPITVVFCGNVYRELRLEIEGHRTDPYHGYTHRQTTVWSDSELEDVARKYKTEPPRRQRRYREAQKPYFGAEKVSEATMAKLIDDKISIMVSELDWYVQTPHWRVNPDILKDVEFYRVMPPFIAHQELSMWVGGVLGAPQNPMVAISDEDRIAKHGFDEWSFRKPPSR
jgi:hypothetical protein